MNKKLLAITVVLLAVGAAVWLATRNPTDDGRELVLHGNVDIRQVELAFNANGRVDQMLVHEGDRVQKGAVAGPARFHPPAAGARPGQGPG